MWPTQGRRAKVSGIGPGIGVSSGWGPRPAPCPSAAREGRRHRKPPRHTWWSSTVKPPWKQLCPCHTLAGHSFKQEDKNSRKQYKIRPSSLRMRTGFNCHHAPCCCSTAILPVPLWSPGPAVTALDCLTPVLPRWSWMRGPHPVPGTPGW